MQISSSSLFIETISLETAQEFRLITRKCIFIIKFSLELRFLSVGLLTQSDRRNVSKQRQIVQFADFYLQKQW